MVPCRGDNSPAERGKPQHRGDGVVCDGRAQSRFSAASKPIDQLAQLLLDILKSLRWRFNRGRFIGAVIARRLREIANCISNAAYAFIDQKTQLNLSVFRICKAKISDQRDTLAMRFQ